MPISLAASHQQLKKENYGKINKNERKWKRDKRENNLKNSMKKKGKGKE